MQEEQTTTTYKHKIKSIISIGILWLLVRFISESNGNGWEKAFYNVAFFFGAPISTLILFSSLFSRYLEDYLNLRKIALHNIIFTTVITNPFFILIGVEKNLMRDTFSVICSVIFSFIYIYYIKNLKNHAK